MRSFAFTDLFVVRSFVLFASQAKFRNFLMHQEEEPTEEQLLAELPLELSKYLAKVNETIKASDAARRSEVRTTEYTATSFSSSKQERLWALKEKGDLTDAVLVTSDGHRESLHLDMLLELEKKGMTPFYTSVKAADSKSKLAEYSVDASLSADTLRQLIFFAYHGRCDVKPENALNLASCGVTYRLFQLLSLCVPFFSLEQAWVPFSDALKAFPLAQASPAHQKAAQILQTYLEDNFEKNWRQHSAELCELPIDAIICLLSSQRLHIKAESSVWLIIQNWTNTNFRARLLYLPELLTNCLRMGLLPESFIRDELPRSPLFAALSVKEKASLNEIFKNVLFKSRSFVSSSIHFRQRDAKHLLVAFGALQEGQRLSEPRIMHIYNHRLNRWSISELLLPPGRSLFGLQYIAGHLYLFGDYSPHLARSLFTLDLSKPDFRWTARAPMSVPRAKMASVVLDGSLYVLGGQNESGVWSRHCERYDAKLDRWFPIASPTYAHSWTTTATVLNGLLYLTCFTRRPENSPTVEVFNPQTDSWSLLAPLPAGFLPKVVPFEGRIWAVDGRLLRCHSYDPLTDTWRQEANPIWSRLHGQAIAFEGTIYLAGGFQHSFDEQGRGFWRDRAQMEKYDRETKRWIDTGANLLQGSDNFHLLSIPNVFPRLYRQREEPAAY